MVIRSESAPGTGTTVSPHMAYALVQNDEVVQFIIHGPVQYDNKHEKAACYWLCGFHCSQIYGSGAWLWIQSSTLTHSLHWETENLEDTCDHRAPGNIMELLVHTSYTTC